MIDMGEGQSPKSHPIETNMRGDPQKMKKRRNADMKLSRKLVYIVMFFHYMCVRVVTWVVEA